MINKLTTMPMCSVNEFQSLSQTFQQNDNIIKDPFLSEDSPQEILDYCKVLDKGFLNNLFYKSIIKGIKGSDNSVVIKLKKKTRDLKNVFCEEIRRLEKEVDSQKEQVDSLKGQWCLGTNIFGFVAFAIAGVVTVGRIYIDSLHRQMEHIRKWS